jgi:hypothetical protein
LGRFEVILVAFPAGQSAETARTCVFPAVDRLIIDHHARYRNRRHINCRIVAGDAGGNDQNDSPRNKGEVWM